MDQGQISIDVGMPIGSEMEETAAIEDRIVRIVEDTVPELDTLYYSTGASSSLMSSGSSVTVMLVDLEDRDRSSQEIANALRENLADIAGCDLSVSTSSTTGSSGSAISLTLSGDDYDELVATGDELGRSHLGPAGRD